MFSSKHIQQAVHLADEALAELNKAENGDQAYTGSFISLTVDDWITQVMSLSSRSRLLSLRIGLPHRSPAK